VAQIGGVREGGAGATARAQAKGEKPDSREGEDLRECKEAKGRKLKRAHHASYEGE